MHAISTFLARSWSKFSWKKAKNMYAFFLIAILVTICQLVDTTQAQQCHAFGSAFSMMGWMLQRHVYKTMLVDIGLRCLMVCRTDDRCQSFNFVMSHHICEFNDRVKEARPEDFIPDPDRYYFRKSLNRGKLNVNSLYPPFSPL